MTCYKERMMKGPVAELKNSVTGPFNDVINCFAALGYLDARPIEFENQQVALFMK